MAISASLVKQLREKTGAGMMECKKALVESDGKLEEASDLLRKKGLAKASKKASRSTSEGVVAAHSGAGRVSLIELNCETDFVTKNEKFIELASKIAISASKFEGNDIEVFKSQPLDGSHTTVGESVVEGVMTIGENIQLTRVTHLNSQGLIVSKYIHNAIDGRQDMGKIAVVVTLQSDSDSPEIEAFGKHVAMHVVAARPESLDIDSLDTKLIEKERKFLKEQALASGKPENVVEKMIDGRMRKFYEETVLLEQISMIDGKEKIKDLLSALASKVGSEVKIKEFVRLQVGETADENNAGGNAGEAISG